MHHLTDVFAATVVKKAIVSNHGAVQRQEESA